MKNCILSILSLLFIATQSASAANRYWIASSAANWNNTANWSISSGGGSGASVPGASDVAIFDNNGLGNCTITGALTISGLTLYSGYTGAILQGANNITISGAASFGGGVFTGGSATITFNGNVTLSGTGFVFPAQTIMNGGSWTYTSGLLNTTTNSSTVTFASGLTITGNETFNNLTFTNTTPWPMTYTLAAGTTLTANGTTSLTGTAYQSFSNGNVNLLGNLALTNTATGGGGSTVFSFTGTGSQSITSALSIGQSALPSVTINKASGTLTLPALITEGGNAWTYTAGTIDATTNNSTVVFSGGTTISGNHTLNNVTFSNTTPWPMTYTIATGTTLTVSGTTSLTGTAYQTFTNGTIALLGNLSLSNTATGGGGTTVFAFTGTGNQQITGSPTLGQSALPSVSINKSSGTLTLNSLLSMSGSTWAYVAGTIDATTNNSTVAFIGNTTISGNHTLRNITFDNSTPWGMTYTLSAGTTLSSTGTVTISGGAGENFSGGTLSILGDLKLTNTSTADGGTTLFTFAGTGNQSIISSLPVNQSSLPSVVINKASGTLTFPSILTIVGNSWTYTAGTLDVTTNNSNVVFGGNTTITGSHTLNNITFNNATPWGITYTVATGTVLTVSGTAYMSGAASIYFSGGTINLLGNLNLANTSTGDGGSTVLAFVGTGNQTISSSLPVNQNSLPSVLINKSSGTLTFPPILTMAGSNWTYTTGTLDVATNNSNVVFGGNTTITGSHTLNNITFNNATPWGITYTIATGTVLTASGTVYMSGAASIYFSGGTINLQGNLNLANTSTGDGGSTVLAFVGTVNQSVVSSLPAYQNALPSVNINKASGTLSFPAILTMAGSNWTYTTGTLDVATNNSTVYFIGNTTITGNHMLNNVNFNNPTPWGITYTVTTGTALTVSGTTTMSGAASIYFSGGTINAQGNLNLTNTSTGDGGTTVLAFTGTGSQVISSSLPVGQNSLPSILINKPSGTLTFPSILTIAGSSWTYTAGTVDAAANASTVYFATTKTVNASGMSFYNLTMSNGTSTLGNNLKVDNNLSITSPGVLSAGANTITLLGNWADWNANGFTEGTSTVVFAGSSVQTITVPGGEIFYNVTTNNSGAGTQLANNVRVSNALTMTQGNIDLNTNTLTIGTSAASPGSLNYTTGTIFNTGSITRWFRTGTIATGSSAGLFPTGTATDYRPFNVSAPSSGVTSGGTVTVSYSDAVTTTSVNFADGAATVLVRKNLNWAVSTGNGLAGGSYNLSVSGTNYGEIGSVSDLRLTLFNGVVGTAGVNGGTTTNPQVNRTSLTASNLNNTFYISSINPGMTSLPVVLVSFNAAPVSGTVVLNWTAVVSGGNGTFTVQRSKDGVAWEPVMQVVGSQGTNVYSATDAVPMDGVSFYKLVVLGQDGAVTYSSVAAVNMGGSATASVSVYPNPVASLLTIASSRAGGFSVSLVSQLGQVMTVVRSENGNQVQMNVMSLPAGVYFVRISGKGWMETRTVVVRH
ncbi:MAG: T9SS type A sorting domain-containing protein [Bacteroidetes bacterium]|nr:T9SS type A sorting domain-containing protein [Bacteroidota bacterium]